MSAFRKAERRIITPRHHEVAIIASVRSTAGALRDDYPGLDLYAGSIKAHDPQALAEAVCTFALDAEAEEALRTWAVKVKTMQHLRTVTGALGRTGTRTIIIAGEPPEGMVRTTGCWTGAGRAGTRWESIRASLAKRAGRRIAGVATPPALSGRLRIDGIAVDAVRADGTLVAAPAR